MRSSYLIKDLSINEKPRERLITNGVQTLTDEELLAIILRSGGKNLSVINLSREILKKFNGFKGLLNTELEQLTMFKNIGLAKATSIKAVCEVSLRMHQDKNTDTYIKNPSDIYNLLKKELYAKTKEYLYLVSLNSKNKVISKDLISIGTVNQNSVYLREIFRTAITKNAVSIILVHSHPSSDTTPSTEDLKMTQDAAKAGKLLDIPLVDHVIIGDNTFKSIKELNVFSLYKFDYEKGGEK